MDPRIIVRALLEGDAYFFNHEWPVGIDDADILEVIIDFEDTTSPSHDIQWTAEPHFEFGSTGIFLIRPVAYINVGWIRPVFQKLHWYNKLPRDVRGVIETTMDLYRENRRLFNLRLPKGLLHLIRRAGFHAIYWTSNGPRQTKETIGNPIAVLIFERPSEYELHDVIKALVADYIAKIL